VGTNNPTIQAKDGCLKMPDKSSAREVTRPQLHSTSVTARLTPQKCNRKKAVPWRVASRSDHHISIVPPCKAKEFKQITHEDNQAIIVSLSSIRHFCVRAKTRVYVGLTGVWSETCLLSGATSWCSIDTDFSTCLALPCGLARHRDRHPRLTDRPRHR
jgi:hypothetical protein